MQWVIWGFAGLAAVVAAIIGVAAWRVFVRDRGVPNQGLRRKSSRARRARATIPRSSGRTTR